jgi:class 3 adenylate cyclase/tetratricopeptide (TPR) repeat protein
MTTKTPKISQVGQLQRALAELMNNREHFTTEAHGHIVRSLLDRIRALQAVPTAQHSPLANSEADEIRLVSVMFIDVKDSTLMAQKLDTEQWKTLIGNAHQTVSAIVEEWDGEVGQYLGDGLLCFFGAQHSRADDAIRAVACALAIQRRMTEFAAQAAATYKVDFALRTAIATGRVVVGMIGGNERREFLAVGQTTNLAARLQGICPPGHVLIDAPTYRRVRNHFVSQAQAPVALKGFDENVESYLVQARRTLTLQDTDYQINGITIPFVGRDQEMDTILGLWHTLLNDDLMRVITVYGEIGNGKSRLLAEITRAIMRDADDHPATLIHMTASYENRAIPFNLLHHFIGEVCDLSEDTSTEEAEARIRQHMLDHWHHSEVEALAAVLGNLAGYGFDDSPHVTPLQRAGEDYEHVALGWLARWCQGLAESTPLLMIVDDMQWADALSLRMLEYLAQTLGQNRIMIVAATRLEFRAAHLDYMASIARHTELTLTPLTYDETVTLLNQILQQMERVPDTMADTIAKRTDGNPLFVEEFLRTLFDNAVFEALPAVNTAAATPDSPRRWKVNAFRYRTTIDQLPSGLLGILQARLDDLPVMGRAVAQTASVVGQTFWEGSVSRLVDFDTPSILADLVQRGIILQHSESRFKGEREYSFRHSLYREVAYEMLTRANREHYHRLTARWLVSRVPDSPEYLPALADHYMRGQQYEQALVVYEASVEDCLERGLMSEALKQVENGLGLSSNLPREVALPLVVKLWTMQSYAMQVLQRHAEATAASSTALKMLDENPNVPEALSLRLRAARVLGSSHRSIGQYEQAVEAFGRAFEMVPEEETADVAALLRSYGVLARCQGNLGESLSYQQRALFIAERLNNDRQRAGALSQLGLIALDRGDFATSIAYFDRVLANNRRTSNAYYQVSDLRNLAQAYRAVYAYELALQALDEAETLQKSIYYQEPLLDVVRGQCYIALGRTEEGLALLQAVMADPPADLYTRLEVQLVYLQALAQTGQYAECSQQAVRFIDEAQYHNPILQGRGMLWYGFALQALGDPEALSMLEKALNQELIFGGREAWLCYYALGTAYAAADQARGREAYQRAAMILRALSSSLHTRPELQITLLNNSFVQLVLIAGA